MSTSAFWRRAALPAAAAFLTHCGTAQSPPLFASSAMHVPSSGGVAQPGPVHVDRARSWMLAPARCGYNKVLPPCGLLYVSN